MAVGDPGPAIYVADAFNVEVVGMNLRQNVGVCVEERQNLVV
jgi:hypothetical protein